MMRADGQQGVPDRMIPFTVMSFGMMAGFILSSLNQNERRGEAHAPALVAAGYFLCGASAAFAAVLGATAIMMLQP